MAARNRDQAAETRKLRVMHVYKDVFPPVVGGIEKQIGLLREAMSEVVSNVVVCSRERRTQTARVDGALEVRVAELGRVLSAPLAPTFPLWVRRVKADLIHLHSPNPTGELAALLAGAGRPIVASYHADVDRQARYLRVYRPLLDACLERAATVVVATGTLAETSPILAPHAEKVRVIGHAVDVERYRPDGVPDELRQALRRRYGSPLVVAVGRLVYYKGYAQLIEAARGLDASVVIVGDGPERGHLMALAVGLPNVHFTGELDEDELIGHLAAGDCFVLASTSRAESFGIAVAEAQAMGLPAVVTDTGGGTGEAVEDGVTGRVVPPRDPNALRDALAELLEDEEGRRRMSGAARERAVSRHALADRAGELQAVYRGALASAGVG